MLKLTRFLVVGLMALLSLGVISASAQSVLQGYSSDESLQKGMLVALKEGDESKVVALTDKNAEKFKGVIVDKNDSPVTISNEERKIFVATSGPYEVLVTNENGPIKKGDYIAVASTSGIGAKATENQEFVVGVAATDFAGTGDSLGSTTAQRSVGRIKIDVNFAKNPGKKSAESNKIPVAVKKLGEAIADKPLSTLRLYIGLAVFSVASAITAVMLYSGVRNAVISIGRNPLSKGKIIKGLVQVVLFALIIFIVGLFGVYLVLKL